MTTDIAAVIIASCALLFTVLCERRNRKHIRLMAKPHLIVSRERGSDENTNKTTFSISIQNNGLGPAEFKYAEVLFDGAECEMCEFPLKSIVRALYGDREGFAIKRNGWLTKGYIIPPGQRHLLIEFEVVGYGEEIQDTIIEESRRADFVIHYSSLYGDPFELDTRH